MAKRRALATSLTSYVQRASYNPPSDFRLRHPCLHTGSAQRIDQQACNRHRPDAARHRRYRPGDLQRFAKIHIAHDPRFAIRVDAIDADIDDRGARPDPSAANEFGPADRDTEDLGALAQRWQIARSGMRDRHRRIFLEQELRQRTADDMREA